MSEHHIRVKFPHSETINMGLWRVNGREGQTIFRSQQWHWNNTCSLTSDLTSMAEIGETYKNYLVLSSGTGSPAFLALGPVLQKTVFSMAWTPSNQNSHCIIGTDQPERILHKNPLELCSKSQSEWNCMGINQSEWNIWNYRRTNQSGWTIWELANQNGTIWAAAIWNRNPSSFVSRISLWVSPWFTGGDSMRFKIIKVFNKSWSCRTCLPFTGLASRSNEGWETTGWISSFIL